MCDFICDGKFFPILFVLIIVSTLISFITIFTVSFGYGEEDALYNAIKTANYNRPIIDISLTKKNENYQEITLMTYEDIKTFCDCTHNDSVANLYERKCYENELIFTRCNEYNTNATATKFYNTILYVKYYNIDYFGLLDRIEVGNEVDGQKSLLCK